MKSYEIEILAGNNILQLQFYGKVTLKVANAVREEASSIAKEQGIKRVLIDVQQAEVVATTMELFNFYSLDYKIWRSEIRLAFITKPENWDPNDALFSENVAVNRGMTRQYFSNREDAIAWLNESEDI